MNVVLFVSNDRGGGDFYAGLDAAIYVDGERKWDGESCNQVADILDAIGVTYERRDIDSPLVWPDDMEALS